MAQNTWHRIGVDNGCNKDYSKWDTRYALDVDSSILNVQFIGVETMRVTKHMLEVRLGRINRTLHTSEATHYSLNNAPCYGGWQLTANKGSTIIQHRLPPKQMLNYLDGMILGLDMAKHGVVK